jgi:hypothetical protein
MFDGKTTHRFDMPGLQGNISDYNELVDTDGNYGIQKDDQLFRFNGKGFDLINIGHSGDYFDHLFTDPRKRLWLFSEGSSEIWVLDPGSSSARKLDVSAFGLLSGGIAAVRRTEHPTFLPAPGDQKNSEYQREGIAVL